MLRGPPLRMPRSMPAGDRSDRAGDLNSGPDLSRDGRDRAGRARHHHRRCVRSAGGLFWLCLRARDGRWAAALGAFKRALVIGAETFSRILDWNDRTTCVLFGDGAGAVVLEAQESAGTRDDRGLLTAHLRSDGRHKLKLYVDGGRRRRRPSVMCAWKDGKCSATRFR